VSKQYLARTKTQIIPLERHGHHFLSGLVHTLTGRYSSAIPSHGGLSTALPPPDSCVTNPTYNHQNDVRNFHKSLKPTRRILTAVPQSAWKRPAGRPRTSWLATMKNEWSFHKVSVEDVTELALGRSL